MGIDVRAAGLAVALGGSGVLHLVRPRAFDWMVPPELGPARPWVTGSGVAELATAGLLAVPGTRWLGGWAAAGLLAAFVPAHLHTVRALRGRRRTVALARLPFQVPMVAAALRVARSR